MLAALQSWFFPTDAEAAHAVYANLVEQARLPEFYAAAQVPDSLDGRFDMIVLHVCLVLQRLQREQDPNVQRFARTVSEAFFADMDRNLREMGVTDTGVGKRIKRMATAFYGRMDAYRKALESGTLTGALQRNLYGQYVPSTDALEALTRYVDRARIALDETSTAAILENNINWPSIA